MTPELRDKVLRHFQDQIEAKRKGMDTAASLDDLRKLQGEIKAFKHSLDYIKQEMREYLLDD